MFYSYPEHFFNNKYFIRVRKHTRVCLLQGVNGSIVKKATSDLCLSMTALPIDDIFSNVSRICDHKAGPRIRFENNFSHRCMALLIVRLQCCSVGLLCIATPWGVQELNTSLPGISAETNRTPNTAATTK
jgi:hypothetical protein